MVDPAAIHRTIQREAHQVLVVDDNASTRYVMSRYIRAAGFQVIEAASGTEALQKSSAGLAAVVLDVHLPDINGIEVCRRLRLQEDTARIPVMHVSATYIQEQDHVAGLNAGADSYMIHPIEPAVMVATLQALIRARTAEDGLRHSERRFRAIYDQASSGIVLMDTQGRLVDANPAMQALLGRTALQLIGHCIAEFVPAPLRGGIEDLLARPMRDTSAWRGEFPIERADGATVHLDWQIAVHMHTGLLIGIAVDVSARHELDARRLELLEREQAARATAEQHSRTKDDFIAVLSHELRTPLNAIMGWVHILKRRGATAESTKGLDAIERNVKTQARIISDILDVSRINLGKLRLEREYTNPAELITLSLASLSGPLADKHIESVCQVEGAHLPAWIDAARFQQIFWNLMTNAIKFSPDRGKISVVLRRQGNALHLDVQDGGQGISSEFLPHLFERFTQSAAPGNRRHGGLGLGLSIVKHLVDLHGGGVSAESAGAGLGTTMHVWVPAESGSAGADIDFPDRRQVEEPEEHGRVLDGLDVLLVEDDLEACEMMAMVFGDRGARIRIAHDHDEAAQALVQAWPDLMVCDIGLPGRDGYDVVRWARAAQPTGLRRLPIIALTAFSRAEDQQKCLRAGFDMHLAKPLRPHLLMQGIRSLLGAAAPLASSSSHRAVAAAAVPPPPRPASSLGH